MEETGVVKRFRFISEAEFSSGPYGGISPARVEYIGREL
jgi:hypothetical protein